MSLERPEEVANALEKFLPSALERS
jgi:hypothetical protein